MLASSLASQSADWIDALPGQVAQWPWWAFLALALGALLAVKIVLSFVRGLVLVVILCLLAIFALPAFVLIEGGEGLDRASKSKGERIADCWKLRERRGEQAYLRCIRRVEADVRRAVPGQDR